MKDIAIIATLRSTDEFDCRAPYVYLELTGEHAGRMKAVEALCAKVAGMAELAGLSRVAVDGPRMTPLAELPALSTEQVQQLEDNDSLILPAPLPEDALRHSEVCLICPELHLFVHCGWYAIANDKYTRDIYEANLGGICKNLCPPGK